MRLTIVVAGWEFTIEVGPQEKVLEIKRKIEHLLSVPVASQTLTIWGWEMIDGLDMEDYPITTDGTKIHLTISSPLPLSIENNISKIRITVKFSARKIDMEVEKTETVRSLKEKIHIIDGTPIKRMALYFSGNEMEEDFRHLHEYGLADNSEILVFLKNPARSIPDPPSRRLSLVVQTSSSLLNSACIPLEMIDLSTIADLKELLLSRKILPQDDYIFIHKQRIMKDNCSLRWHGVENGDYLYVFKGTISRGEC